MLGIAAIGHYLPASRVSNLDRAQALAMEDSFIHEKLGFLELARAGTDETASSMASLAVQNLAAQSGLALDEIDCLVVCTQTQDGHGIPHTSALVHAALGLKERCAAFDIGLGCSGYVYGLATILGFMQVAGLRNGVLVTADPYSKILDPTDRNTEPIFGDAATATWIRPDAPWLAGPFDLRSQGSEGDALCNASGRLAMNGRAVFNFTLTRVPEQIRHLLDQAGLGLDQVDTVLLHQGSRYIVEQIAHRLGLQAGKVPFAAAHYGNTVSSSIPLLLEPHLTGNENCILLSGFGVGLSWASCLLRRNPALPPGQQSGLPS